MTLKNINGKLVQVHNADYSYDESENQAGISHCSTCGKVTAHPIDDAIEVTVGNPCSGVAA